MNLAEDKRNARIEAMDDGELLEVILNSGDLSEVEVHAFADMRAGLVDPNGPRRGLSKRQRAWAEEVARRVVPIRAEEVPRGREVVDPVSLRRENLPLKPPGRGR
jgi:hypothetical protein